MQTGEVPHQRLHTIGRPAEDRVGRGRLQFLVAQLVQELIPVIRRFVQALNIDQAEAAMKW